MSRDHGNSRFDVFGTELVKLYNDRYRIIVRVDISNFQEDWYASNKANFWKQFGSKYGDEITVDGSSVGWTPDDGEEYENMYLIATEMKYLGGGKVEPVLEFIYETLTDSYVQDAADQVDYELNGLRRVTRTLIAKEDSAYIKEVGADSIQSSQLGRPEVTLYLATVDEGQKDVNEGGFTRIQEVWLEPGQLFERESNPSDGLKSITTGWWYEVGTTVGPIIEKSTENVEGFEVLTITTMTSPDGSDIVDGNDDKLVATYEDLANWTRPGILGLVEEKRFADTTVDTTRVAVWQQAPSQMKIRVRVGVYYSKDDSISDADFDTITGGAGVKYWNPDSWAKVEGGSTNNIDATYAGVDTTYRGFRVIDPDDAAYSSSGDTLIRDTANARLGGQAGGDTYLPEWFGSFPSNLVAVEPVPPGDANGYVLAVANAVGGPGRPEGKTWMIDVQNPKAFTDVDGVDYYKKTYVWSYIPDFDAGEDIWDDAP